MSTLITRLWTDEAGFLISGELVLVSTIVTLGMVVGLSEVSVAINHELGDVAAAFGSVNQSYRYQGLFDDDKSSHDGSGFRDYADDCDRGNSVAGYGG